MPNQFQMPLACAPGCECSLAAAHDKLPAGPERDREYEVMVDCNLPAVIAANDLTSLRNSIYQFQDSYPNKIQNYVNRLFYAASCTGRVKVMKFLLKTQSPPANVNFKEKKDGTTALHAAAMKGYVTVTSVLLRFGADPTISAQLYGTPLHLAIEKSHCEVAQLLVEKTENLSTADRDGQTPLIRAILQDNMAGVKVLLEKGADAEAPRGQDKKGPLYLAASAGNYAACELLLQFGANPRRKLTKGKVPFEVTKKGGQRLDELFKKYLKSEIAKPLNEEVVTTTPAGIKLDRSMFHCPICDINYAKWMPDAKADHIDDHL